MTEEIRGAGVLLSVGSLAHRLIKEGRDVVGARWRIFG